MPSGCYRVEVLHFLSPHLIWVAVVNPTKTKESGFIFEQIGLYGVVPSEPVLDVLGQNLRARILDNWLPGASAALRDALSESQEVWFNTTYIDKRPTIFDDDIHKFGEILYKEANGKFSPLSVNLTKSGLAKYDVFLFHQELGNGKLITTLQSLEAQEVIKNIEIVCEKKNISKVTWPNSDKTKTVVTHTSQEFKKAITVMNLEKHNKELMAQVLQNKKKDFELCKGIDEESAGRAYKTKPKRESIDTESKNSDTLECTEPVSKSTILERKLRLMGSKKINNIDNVTNQNIDEIMNILQRNVDNSQNDKQDTVIGNENDDLSQNEPKTLSSDGNDKMSSKLNEDSNDQNLHFTKDNSNEDKNPKTVMERTNGSKFCKKVVYGPPGISPSVLPSKIVTQNDCDEKHMSTETFVENAEGNTKKEDIHVNLDSNVNVDMTNNAFQAMKIEKDHIITGKTLADAVENKNEAISIHSNTLNAAHDDSSSDAMTQPSKSKVLNKKVMLYEGRVGKESNCSFTSDTTNKDSSSSFEEMNTKQNDEKPQDMKDSDDEEDEEIMKIIEKDYVVVNKLSEPKMSEPLGSVESYDSVMKAAVNPFKNTDSNICSFTDKVIAPVLMVHTKMNKRIEPVLKISDLHFTKHIQAVLKNMSIDRPMMLQTVSWFCILRGYSTFLVGPASSGKTLGYLPAVCRLVSDSCPADDAGVGPKCIILCATSKSVAEVERLAKMFLGVKEKVLACFAGVDETYISTSLLNGCDLLISTPSCLVRLLQVADFGIDMRRLATVVMDDFERLSDVYRNEVKYILFRIKYSIKSRTNKELKVQYVLASRIWCDLMEPIVKKAPYSVVCISAFQECVLYSKVNLSVKFVQKNNKMNSVNEFLDNIDLAKKIVIVCNTDAEVDALRKALGKYDNTVFACDSSLTIEDLYNLSGAWNDYENPLLGPILLCCDDTLVHLNISDAHYLLSYSLPRLFSSFCKRFSVLNDNYHSIFKSGSTNLKIKVLVEESNMEQLPKMINFIKRCTDSVPEQLNEICHSVLAEKDCVKASKCVPICDNLLSFGNCRDFWNCLSRHSVFKEHDDSKKWMPKKGLITFKVLHYHTAVLYSVRLLSNIVSGLEHKFPQTYSGLSLKMGWYYSKKSNRKLQGIPKIGDICAVAAKPNYYARCQIMNILSHYPNGNPNNVLVKLIDEETFEISRDIFLYHLPEHLKNIETRIVQVRLANLQPKDKDVTFSNLAKEQLKKITDTHDDLFLLGHVIMAVGNCVFVDTLEACQELSSLSKIVVKYDLKSDLLERHATINIEHVPNIRKLCEGRINIVEEMPLLSDPANTPPRGTWAHLEEDELSLVYFEAAFSPHKFFVRLAKCQSDFEYLSADIQKYVAENPERLRDVKVNDLVLAMYPDEETYDRARIETFIDANQVRCFFLDHGDWRDVSCDDLAPLKEEFITKMPFQAIECRLVGVQPNDSVTGWTDSSTDWFCDQCYDEPTDQWKPLYVKNFYKDKAECTGGNKYGVAMIDTNGVVDVVINKVMIGLGLAKPVIKEMKYLDELDNLDYNFKPPGNQVQTEATVPCNMPILQNIVPQPIVSVPLVNCNGENSDGSEQWQINMPDDFLTMFKPATVPVSPTSDQASITMDETSDFQQTDEVDPSEDFVLAESTPKELDSKDCTSPDSTGFVNDSVKETERVKEKKYPGGDQESTEFVNDSVKEMDRVEEKEKKYPGGDQICAGFMNDFVKETERVKEKEKKYPGGDQICAGFMNDFVKETERVKEKEKKIPGRDQISAGFVNDSVKETERVKEKKYLGGDQIRKPRLVWRQNQNSVIIKINLIGLQVYDLTIQGRSISFAANTNGAAYVFDFELYGAIDVKKSSHCNKGLYVLVKLSKLMNKKWLTLTKDCEVRKWIVYDLESIETSSDEEDAGDQTKVMMLNAVKNMVDEGETESEDDDFMDDLNFGPKGSKVFFR